jgi:hypothetical protein
MSIDTGLLELLLSSLYVVLHSDCCILKEASVRVCWVRLVFKVLKAIVSMVKVNSLHVGGHFRIILTRFVREIFLIVFLLGYVFIIFKVFINWVELLQGLIDTKDFVLFRVNVCRSSVIFAIIGLKEIIIRVTESSSVSVQCFTLIHDSWELILGQEVCHGLLHGWEVVRIE